MSRYIGSPEWIASNTGKLGLRRIGGVMLNWSVIDHTGRILPKGDYIARFDTHAEAITYAHREATKAMAARNQLPDRLKPCACTYEAILADNGPITRHNRTPEPMCPQHRNEDQETP